MRANPQPYQIYKHFKGNLYQIISLASDSETCDTQVVYQALYSPYKVWIRPLTMFMSEVDHDKYPEITQEYRFELQVNLPNDKQDVTKEAAQRYKTIQINNTIQTETASVNSADSTDEDFDEDVALDPLVLEFLDSDTYEQKLNILASLHSRITNEMINTMAIAMDVEVGDGDVEQRFIELRNCVQTFKKYECSRLR